MKEVIDFKNDQGIVLRGILQYPDDVFRPNKNDIVIFPNGGLMGCEGDFRAYVRISKHLNEAGFYVFRFSPSGLGLSDGNIEDIRQNELFAKIETGLFVEDIKTAVKYIQSYNKFDSITLSGICGGAISSLIASSELLKDVDFTIPIGVPVVLDSDIVNYSARMPKEFAKFILRTYVWKIVSLKSWHRLLNKKSDMKTIKSVFRSIFSSNKSSIYIDDEGSDANLNSNPEFFKAVNKLIDNDINILFIFGDIDKIWWEFKKMVLDKFHSNSKKIPFDYHIIKNANHMLTWVEMQTETMVEITNWLKKGLSTE